MSKRCTTQRGGMIQVLTWANSFDVDTLERGDLTNRTVVHVQLELILFITRVVEGDFQGMSSSARILHFSRVAVCFTKYNKVVE